MESEIRSQLGDLVRVDFVVYDASSYFVKFETGHMGQPLLDAISARLKAMGLTFEISSLSSQSVHSESTDIVVLRVFPTSEAVLRSPWPPRSRWSWLSHPAVNLTLFIITFVLVFITGAATILNRSYGDPWNWLTGFQFSFSLMGILLAHEFGHYFAAKYHKMDVTLPYFLPGVWLPGTFGAFIRIRSPIQNKRQLMDVGAAGPIAGFIVCLVVLLYGFVNIPDKTYAYQFYDPESIYSGNPVLNFGNSALFSLLGSWLAGDRMPAMYDIIHYPFLFAGWFGLLVTALNLMPVGQLDGGHITYALMGTRQKYVGMVTFASIIGIGILTESLNWFVWAIFILLLIRIKHPPVLDEQEPLDERRRVIGWIAVVIFFLCFSVNPVYFEVYTR